MGPFNPKKIWHLVPKVNHNLSTVEGVQTDLTGVALAATTAETFHPNSFHEFSYQFYENSHQRNGCCVFLRKIVTTYTNLMSFFSCSLCKYIHTILKTNDEKKSWKLSVCFSVYLAAVCWSNKGVTTSNNNWIFHYIIIIMLDTIQKWYDEVRKVIPAPVVIKKCKPWTLKTNPQFFKENNYFMNAYLFIIHNAIYGRYLLDYFGENE